MSKVLSAKVEYVKNWSEKKSVSEINSLQIYIDI